MKKYALTFFLGLTTVTAVQAENDPQRGEKLFNQSCALCHGKQAEKSAMNQSAIVNTLEADEIIESLQLRKEGKIKGAGNAAKARLNEQDIKNIAEYIQTLK